MKELEALFGDGGVNIQVSVKDEDIVKITAYLTVGIFVAVLLAVIIANKIKL